MQDRDVKIDLYSEGACVYEVDHKGNVLEVVGWARNHGAAKATFEYLCAEYPTTGYQVRNRARVYGERPPTGPVINPATEIGGVHVSDLREWHVVTARCEACSRQVNIGKGWFVAKFEPETQISEIAPRLSCRVCRNRDTVRLTVTKQPR